MTFPGTRNAFAERSADGYFLDVTWDRQALARYGLSIDDAQNALSTAVGGENVTTLIKGRERYPSQRTLSARLPFEHSIAE
jgi:Cu(I)/Ag(I) efflux system membrane protein CusA/SilA